MIALAITLVICVCAALVAYWARDVALRWMAEGQAAEDVAKLRLDLDEHIARTKKGFAAADEYYEQVRNRVNAHDARIDQAESIANEARTRATLGPGRRAG